MFPSQTPPVRSAHVLPGPLGRGATGRPGGGRHLRRARRRTGPGRQHPRGQPVLRLPPARPRWLGSVAGSGALGTVAGVAAPGSCPPSPVVTVPHPGDEDAPAMGGDGAPAPGGGWVQVPGGEGDSPSGRADEPRTRPTGEPGGTVRAS